LSNKNLRTIRFLREFLILELGRVALAQQGAIITVVTVRGKLGVLVAGPIHAKPLPKP